MACTIDFRNLDEGFGGKTLKRKRESQTLITPTPTPIAAAMDIDLNQPLPKRHAIASSENPNKPAGTATYDGTTTGKVSGRNWKAARTRASARKVTGRKMTHEEREREREVKKAYRERKEELKEEIRRNKEEKRKKREEREKKKLENVFKSGTKFQVVSNPKTIKKLAKSKKKKLLKVVPDEFVRKNNQKN